MFFPAPIAQLFKRRGGGQTAGFLRKNLERFGPRHKLIPNKLGTGMVIYPVYYRILVYSYLFCMASENTKESENLLVPHYHVNFV